MPKAKMVQYVPNEAAGRPLERSKNWGNTALWTTFLRRRSFAKMSLFRDQSFVLFHFVLPFAPPSLNFYGEVA